MNIPAYNCTYSQPFPSKEQERAKYILRTISAIQLKQCTHRTGLNNLNITSLHN